MPAVSLVLVLIAVIELRLADLDLSQGQTVAPSHPPDAHHEPLQRA